MPNIPSMPNWLLILLLCGAFITGFFVGGRHKVRVLRAAGMLKDTLGKL